MNYYATRCGVRVSPSVELMSYMSQFEVSCPRTVSNRPASLQTLDVSAQETAEQKEVRLVTEAGSNVLWYAPAT